MILHHADTSRKIDDLKLVFGPGYDFQELAR